MSCFGSSTDYLLNDLEQPLILKAAHLVSGDHKGLAFTVFLFCEMRRLLFWKELWAYVSFRRAKNTPLGQQAGHKQG